MDPFQYIVWSDERNVDRFLELNETLWRSTDRRADKLLRTVPIFPDEPRIVLPREHILLPSRELIFANELQIRDELLHFNARRRYKKDIAQVESQNSKGGLGSVCKEFVCGPDVTQQVLSAIKKTKSTFASWDDTRKEGACRALIALNTASYAWDIMDLHDISAAATDPSARNWVLDYRPECGTVGATPPCGTTVQVGNQCFFAGSANYVIFGIMMRLCYEYRSRIDSETFRHTKGFANLMINLYKPNSGNKETCKKWTHAGYDGWPDTASTPAGDRANCKPICTKAFMGAPFWIHWVTNPEGGFNGSRNNDVDVFQADS